MRGHAGGGWRSGSTGAASGMRTVGTLAGSRVDITTGSTGGSAWVRCANGGIVRSTGSGRRIPARRESHEHFLCLAGRDTAGSPRDGDSQLAAAFGSGGDQRTSRTGQRLGLDGRSFQSDRSGEDIGRAGRSCVAIAAAGNGAAVGGHADAGRAAGQVLETGRRGPSLRGTRGGPRCSAPDSQRWGRRVTGECGRAKNTAKRLYYASGLQ